MTAIWTSTRKRLSPTLIQRAAAACLLSNSIFCDGVGTFGLFYASSKYRWLWECKCSWSCRLIFFWDDFCFLFSLPQIGLAPERVEPSGWQGSEQKVTSVGASPSAIAFPSQLPTTPESLLFFETSSGFIDLQALSPLCVWMVSVHFGLLLCRFSWATEREYLKLCVFTQQRRSLESRGLEGSAPLVFSSLFVSVPSGDIRHPWL